MASEHAHTHHMHTHVRICSYQTCKHTRTYICTHTHIHIHTHTHTHTHATLHRRRSHVRSALTIALNAIGPEFVLGLPLPPDPEMAGFLDILLDAGGDDVMDCMPPPGCLSLQVTKYLVCVFVFVCMRAHVFLCVCVSVCVLVCRCLCFRFRCDSAPPTLTEFNASEQRGTLS